MPCVFFHKCTFECLCETKVRRTPSCVTIYLYIKGGGSARTTSIVELDVDGESVCFVFVLGLSELTALPQCGKITRN